MKIIRIIIIRRIRIIRKKNKNKKDKIKSCLGRSRRRRLTETIFVLFSFFCSFSDLWKLDRMFLLKLKAKLDYAKRATHRYQYLSLLSNFKR